MTFAWIRASLFLLATLTQWPVCKAAEPTAPFHGFWSGWAERDGVRSEVAVRLFTSGGELTGTVDWPDMGYYRTDLIGVRIERSETTMSVPLPVGAVKLVGAIQGDAIEGTLEPIGLVRGEWQSLGKEGAFELRRGDEPPVPYSIEDVSFRSGDATIAGSLFRPQGNASRPGIVYVAGSGSTTRGDGAFLADRLARAGIAALVYDKRGAGRSTSDWRRGGFEELADDATEALKLLQHQPGINASRTGFVCQSQGCWIVPIALRRSAPAHFVVAQSGPSVPVADEDLDYYRVTLVSQGFGPKDVDEAFVLIRINQQVTLGTKLKSELDAVITEYQERAWFKELGFAPSPDDAPERFFERKTLDYDPSADIDAIRIPSLWIYGDADTIIPVQASLDRLRHANGTPRPEIKILRGAGHSFTIGETVIPRLAAEYPGLVIEWVLRQR